MTHAERLAALTFGSVWQKSISGKYYKVVGFAVSTTTNNLEVVFQKIEGSGVPGPWLTRPIGEWLGDVVDPRPGPSGAHARDRAYSRTFVPRLVPVEEIT